MAMLTGYFRESRIFSTDSGKHVFVSRYLEYFNEKVWEVLGRVRGADYFIFCEGVR